MWPAAKREQRVVAAPAAELLAVRNCRRDVADQASRRSAATWYAKACPVWVGKQKILYCEQAYGLTQLH